MRKPAILAAFSLLGAVMTACGGAHTALPAPAGSSMPTAVKQTATFTITVPEKSASPAARKPAYISPATQSIAIAVYDGTHTTLLQTANQNITTGAPGCTTPTPISPLTCAITLALVPGSYAFDFTTYDGVLNGSNMPTGNRLSANLDVPFTVVMGAANDIGVTLGGIPVSVALSPDANSALSGNSSAGYTLGVCGSSQTVSVFGVDADNNYILGTGAPAVALTSDTPSDVSVSPAGASTPNAFTLSCPAAAPWGATVHLTATATPASGTGTSASTASVALTLYHAVGGSITEYGSGITTGSRPLEIAAGPDGALWFAELHANRIGRISTTGSVTEYAIPTASSDPWGIAAGSDGALWFTEAIGNKIGRITTGGSVTEYSTGLSASSDPYDIAAGSDGALWFTESAGNKIGRITTSGSITEYAIPTAFSDPWGIAAGPDGALWFAESAGNKIGRITTTGTITEYTVPTASSSPLGITAGPDGALWFTEDVGNKIGRITTAGSITEYSTGLTAGSELYDITAGPDGALWFTERSGNQVGRITTAGSITEYTVPTGSSFPDGITAGPDGAVWFTEDAGNKIGRVQ